MFCPSCKCEFRPSFTRCASCDVDLVDSLDAVEETIVKPSAPASVTRVRMAEVCGYFDLDEARRARDLLHENDIQGEVHIRSSPETKPGGAVVEEYWLCADASQMARVVPLIDQDPEPSDAPAGDFNCSNCGRPVREEETFCANCGMRFAD